jgi:hypothetical protein
LPFTSKEKTLKRGAFRLQVGFSSLNYMMIYSSELTWTWRLHAQW